jgi:hypothetical protein
MIKMLTSTIFVLAAGFALPGCATSSLDHHVLKLDQPCEHVIGDPYLWALQQFSDGPISGPDVSDYARRVLQYGLKQAVADLGGDGSWELFLRRDCPARAWEVLVFAPVKGGYRYLGHFPAGLIVPNNARMSVLVYVPCGGQCGLIRNYTYNGKKFVCDSAEEITTGDDAPEENHRRMKRQFPKEKVLRWTKTSENGL